MQGNSRLTVAVHTLTLLAQAEQEPLTSEYIAGSVTTNAVVIRRILGALREAGLVVSQPGNCGGWRLHRAASCITLRDVYRAVEDSALFAMHTQQPNPACPVGRNIQRALGQYFGEAQQALEARLATTTITDVLQAVLASATQRTEENGS